MKFVLQPWQLLFAILLGWVSRRQQEIIDFQNAQIEVLLKMNGKKRNLLTDDQRRLLAVKAKSIGRRALRRCSPTALSHPRRSPRRPRMSRPNCRTSSPGCQPFELLEWQWRQVIAPLFGWKRPDGTRR